MKFFYLCLTACLIVMSLSAVAAQEFVVFPSGQIQQAPDADAGTVVWQQNTGANSWDIYGLDLDDTNAPVPIVIAASAFDQINPAVWGNRVVWQDNDTTGGDWNIKMADISDANVPQDYVLDDFEGDQTSPAIHGDLAVWQDNYNENNSDLYAADITDPANPYLFEVDTYDKNQVNPSIYRNMIIYQDDTDGDWDIIAADAWLKNGPAYQYPAFEAEDETAVAIDRDTIVYQRDFSGDGTDYDIIAIDRSDPRVFVTFPVSQLAFSEENPDISGHIIVWQDNRNVNWDIYGYNLVTKKEFQIPTDLADQTSPAISGNLVVWEDARTVEANIYAVYLDAVDMADCSAPLAGDADGNCRVDLVDFVQVAENWLACDLEPADACTSN
ncbi:MAG: hypothetical protein H8E62_01120 [Planctomycetes bacterium]|nr:hypothetical protein [Planctomycetota bacterium]